jgi:predicted nucleic acid-binding protein
MKILLDTNVMLDTFLIREPYNKHSDAIFDLISDNNIIGYINTSSITDIYYVLRKKFNDTESREKIRTLLNLLRAIDVTRADCFSALDSPISDFEDALVAVCAAKEGLDFIVTRDDEFLKIPKAISPSGFLEKLS